MEIVLSVVLVYLIIIVTGNPFQPVYALLIATKFLFDVSATLFVVTLYRQYLVPIDGTPLNKGSTIPLVLFMYTSTDATSSTNAPIAIFLFTSVPSVATVGMVLVRTFWYKGFPFVHCPIIFSVVEYISLLLNLFAIASGIPPR